MAYEGKLYKHVRDENFDSFVNSSGLSAEQAASFLSYKPNQKLEKNGDTYTITAITDKGSREMSFKIGVEFDETMVPGRVSKTTFTLDGNTLTQVQKYEDGVTVTTKREYSGDDLTVTLQRSNWDGPPAIRYYTKA